MAQDPQTTPQPGSFELLEERLHALNDQAKGLAFEKLCCQFLKTDPVYSKHVKQVWLWQDWPERWGPDVGIDIMVETLAGDLWAVQAKAVRADRSISKREIDSFLSESNRPEIKYRLLIATTDNLGRNARKTLQTQEKPIGIVLRGNLVQAELIWPDKVGPLPKKLPRKKPRPHQAKAIRDVVKGFQDHRRGQLIMACGTGKTLTSLWINERLKSRRMLVLVPSLSLVSQTLHEWSRNCKQPFESLVVCSDETVVKKGGDEATPSTVDLGIPVTTDPDEIRMFLRRRSKHPTVVFCTYQSSDRIAIAQESRVPKFDLVLADEAHRCAGGAAGLFGTVLDNQRIKAERRLFLTATPRYFSKQARQQAKDRDHELASMDDVNQFGPVLHEITFAEAITAGLLTDYQVAVIGVTNAEARKLVEAAELVSTRAGVKIDARTLASQIGLAKAVRKYNLQKIISFHSTVAKAKSFADPADEKSFPSLVHSMPRSSRPTGQLWTKHISGDTPTGKRNSLIKHFAGLSETTRGLLANCSCLGEGVDVPVLDGVAFIAPKRSQVDIIQAVGRVIRKSVDKEIGTIVIPLFVDDSEDANEALSKSAFEPVWRVICALRAHDKTLADELDSLRLNLGRLEKEKSKLKLPDKIHLDLPRTLPSGFADSFYVRTVEATTHRQFLPFAEARAFVHTLRLQSLKEWQSYSVGRMRGKPARPSNIPSSPTTAYAGNGWIGWGDWLGTGNIAARDRYFRPFVEARSFVHKLKLQSGTEWRKYYRGLMPGLTTKPDDIPANPNTTYAGKGWSGMGDWLGTGRVANRDREFLSFKQARAFVRKLKLHSSQGWKDYCLGKIPNKPPKPDNIPTNPQSSYHEQGWNGWGDWIGRPDLDLEFLPYKQARAFARSLKLNTHTEWRHYLKGKIPGKPVKPKDVPGGPYNVYKGAGWISWGDWLGTRNVGTRKRKFRPFKAARTFVRKLKLGNENEWRRYTKGLMENVPPLPDDIPATPGRKYDGKGWSGMGDWLGTGRIADQHRVYMEFAKARKFVHKLRLKSRTEWIIYCKGEMPDKPPKPDSIPVMVHQTYRDKGWSGVADWLGY